MRTLICALAFALAGCISVDDEWDDPNWNLESAAVENEAATVEAAEEGSSDTFIVFDENTSTEEMIHQLTNHKCNDPNNQVCAGRIASGERVLKARGICRRPNGSFDVCEVIEIENGRSE